MTDSQKVFPTFSNLLNDLKIIGKSSEFMCIFSHFLKPFWGYFHKILIFQYFTKSSLAGSVSSQVQVINHKPAEIGRNRNIFGWLSKYVSNNLNDLKKQNNPIGKLNDHAITDICANASMIVLAWGNGNKKRANDVLSLLGSKKLHCIDKNKGGGFLHPSRIKTKDYPHAKKI